MDRGVFPHRSVVIVISVAIFALWGHGYGQSPRIDHIKRLTVKYPDNRLYKAMLCEAYSHAILLDQANACLDELPADASANEQAIVHITRSSIEGFEGNYDKSLHELNQAVRLAQSGVLNDSLTRKAYSNFLRYFYLAEDCEVLHNLELDYLKWSRKRGEPRDLLYCYMRLAGTDSCSNTDPSKYLDSATYVLRLNNHLEPLYNELMGDYLYAKNEKIDALSHYLLSFSQYEENGNETALADLGEVISSIYYELNHNLKSLEYERKALKYVLKHAPGYAANIFNSISFSFLKLGQFDSALYYAKRSLNTLLTYAGQSQFEALPLGNIGLAYYELGQIDSAIHYSQRAAWEFERQGDVEGQVEAYNNLGRCYLKLGQIRMAKEYFNRALSLSVEYDYPIYEHEAHYGLYQCLKKSDPVAALNHLEAYTELKHLDETSVKTLMAQQIEEEFIQRQLQEKLSKLKIESEVKTMLLERKNFRILIFSIALVVALSLIIIIVAYSMNRRKLLEKLNTVNQNSERIIRMISHDFRSPLNNIKGLLELLIEKRMTQEEFMAHVKDLHAQTEEVSLMFDSFLSWALHQKENYTPKIERCDWSEIVEEAIAISDPIARFKGVTIERLSYETIFIETDPMAAVLILRNLLSNAIKFSYPNGKIELSYAVRGTNLVTTVRDYGVGMDAKQVAVIMSERMESKKGTKGERGSGIGIDLIKYYTEKLGGLIEVKSEPGKGSEFVVKLPLANNFAPRTV